MNRRSRVTQHDQIATHEPLSSPRRAFRTNLARNVGRSLLPLDILAFLHFLSFFPLIVYFMFLPSFACRSFRKKKNVVLNGASLWLPERAISAGRAGIDVSEAVPLITLIPPCPTVKETAFDCPVLEFHSRTVERKVAGG